jgi:hypothetical protein
MRAESIYAKKLQAVLVLVVTVLLAAGCSTPAASTQTTTPDDALAGIESRWGVRPVAMRLTAAGHFIDFRFKVTDPQKAKAVLDRNHKAYLVDADTGRAMPVPITKLGPLRGSDVMPKAGRNYVILFQNVQRLIESGDRVSVVIGDFKADGLTVS